VLFPFVEPPLEWVLRLFPYGPMQETFKECRSEGSVEVVNDVKMYYQSFYATASNSCGTLAYVNSHTVVSKQVTHKILIIYVHLDLIHI